MEQKAPNGFDLLATLIDLLADQEGVKITYELTKDPEQVHRRRCNNEEIS